MSSVGLKAEDVLGQVYQKLSQTGEPFDTINDYSIIHNPGPLDHNLSWTYSGVVRKTTKTLVIVALGKATRYPLFAEGVRVAKLAARFPLWTV